MNDVLGLGLLHIVTEADRAVLGFVLGAVFTPLAGVLVKQWRGGDLNG